MELILTPATSAVLKCIARNRFWAVCAGGSPDGIGGQSTSTPLTVMATVRQRGSGAGALPRRHSAWRLRPARIGATVGAAQAARRESRAAWRGRAPSRQMLAQRGWTLVRVYSDRMSGAKENRPGLNALMQAGRRGEFDAVVVWRFDRFARSIEQLVLALAEFRALGIDFVSCQEALDTSTPMGKAMFTIIGAMAELERNVIRERVVAGMNYARNHGTKTGNAIGRPKRVFDRSEVVRLRDNGLSIEKIARQMRLGVGTVVRVLQAQ